MNERVEQALTFSARIDIVSLAKVARHLTKEGYRLKTMSQLINWSVEYLESILVQNGHSSDDLDFAGAMDILVGLGLMDRGFSRNAKKVAASTRMAMLRRDNYSPEIVDPRTFNTLHNSHSVEAMPIDRDMEAYQKARLDAQRARYEESEREKAKKTKAYKDAGFIPESSIEEVQKRDKELNNALDNMSLEDMLKGQE